MIQPLKRKMQEKRRLKRQYYRERMQRINERTSWFEKMKRRFYTKEKSVLPLYSQILEDYKKVLAMARSQGIEVYERNKRGSKSVVSEVISIENE